MDQKNKWRQSYWLCLCSCDNKNEIIVTGGHLKSSHTKSCGCLQKEIINKIMTKHGHYKNGKPTRTYKSWASMIQRCTNLNDKDWKNYGDRGIKICKSWRQFPNFLKDMGESPGTEYSIDRINNDGNYCKKNCKWNTQKQQMRNTRKNCLKTYNGKTQCVSAWAEETGISENTLRSRFNYGWSIEKALTTPIRKKKING